VNVAVASINCDLVKHKISILNIYKNTPLSMGKPCCCLHLSWSFSLSVLLLGGDVVGGGVDVEFISK
jgi:hypothetical protein